METRTAKIAAFAKINLGLRILYKRADGYHELRTIFQTISLADRITVAYTPSSTVHIAVEGMPDVPDNLASRAAAAILEEMQIGGIVRIHIEKRIPMGAGLGGGSSDAAALLLTLPVLAGRPVPMSRLLARAAPLGSDVSFFLLGGTALGLGRGEELYPLEDFPARAGVLLVPPVHVSTPDAYRALSPTLTDPDTKLRHFQTSVQQPLAQPLENDFEPVVFAQHPALQAMKTELLASGASQALMSGSGSSLFGLFDRRKALPTPALPIHLLTRARYRSLWNHCLKPHSQGKVWPPCSGQH